MGALITLAAMVGLVTWITVRPKRRQRNGSGGKGMKFVTALTCAIAINVALLSAQALTDHKILAAIKAGQAKKFDHLVSECRAMPGFGEILSANIVGGVKLTNGFDLTLSANSGRIAYMAASAKRLYKPFALADVNDGLREPAVIVTVEPMKPSTEQGTATVAAPIEHVVLKSKAKSAESIQPLRVDMETIEWPTVQGGRVSGNRAVAFFETGAVRELPPGEFDIVVITAAGERRCKVGLKDRQKLFTAM